MKKYKLGDIATVEISGVDKKITDGEKEIRLCNFVDVYYNWAITIAQHDSFMLATARPNEISKFQLKKGQVALTKDSETRDDIGIPTYIADDFEDVILGYHCALISPNKGILDGRYLNALLHTDYAKKYFACNASGSGQRYALSVEALNSFPVPIIPLHEQKQIGEIFSALDKKIELNRQINQNLEAMAKQLYDYWFVQFDFPNEEGKPYKSSGGEMVWNEKLKREIPKEWEIRPLNSLITVKDGTHESPKQQLEGRYLITSKHLLSSGIDYNTAYYISAEDYIAINKRSQVETNDILFSMIGTIGNKYLVAEKNVNFAIKNMALLKTSKSMHIMYFLWLYLSSWDYKHYEFNAISGSIQKFLSLDAMRNIPVPFNYDIAVAFNKQVSNICQCIINLKEENIQLIKQRNELLPLLMNGQVSVNSDLSVYKKRRGKVPSLILNDVSDIQVLHRQSIIVLVKDSSIDEL